jgi:YVTN family beta-propeller protein
MDSIQQSRWRQIALSFIVSTCSGLELDLGGAQAEAASAPSERRLYVTDKSGLSVYDIDTQTKKVAARIPTSAKLIEIDFSNGLPVKTAHRRDEFPMSGRRSLKTP